MNLPVSISQLSDVRPFRVGGYHVEPSTLRLISSDETVLRLEPRSMQVLVYLAEHQGKVVSRAELEEKIWEGRVVGEDALTNTIAKLRRAFADSARNPTVIETLPKTGYHLIAEVDWDEVASASHKRDFSHPGMWVGLLIVLAMLGGGAIWWANQRLAAPGLGISFQGDRLEGIPAVAIMPFENLGDKPQQDYFSNGITTNLITDLAKISGLMVIAQGSVFPYQGSKSGTKDISRELDADYIVRGSVERQDDRVRVNVQLIEAASEQALWAERYDTELNDVFKLQDQVATSLVAALKIELSPDERDIFSRYPTANVQAYDLFLRGLEEYGHRTPLGDISAREHFEQAIELDPKFARAVAGLALVHSRDAIDGWGTTPDQSLDRALDLVGKAKDLNPAIPQVHFVAGQVALFSGRHDEAIEAAQRAIGYSPNYADAYALLAWILNYAGQPEGALAVLATARRLNPVIPASYSVILGEILFSQGNYKAALAEFERALQINPAHMRARMWLVATLVQSESMDEARWQVSELLMLNPGYSLARLRYAFPFMDTSVREKLLNGLRKAGLPEG